MAKRERAPYAALIGRPYSKYNCWQLVREFYKIVYDIRLESYAQEIPEDREGINSLITSNMGHVVLKVDGVPQFGDLMLIKIHGIESHIGVYLGHGKFLHTSIKTGSVIENVDRWERVIVGYYRLKGLDE
jgi:cell wall-associated NlpC family hydrolase